MGLLQWLSDKDAKRWDAKPEPVEPVPVEVNGVLERVSIVPWGEYAPSLVFMLVGSAQVHQVTAQAMEGAQDRSGWKTAALMALSKPGDRVTLETLEGRPVRFLNHDLPKNLIW
jgi:hypothetical protein